MGVIKRGILGGFSNKVANVVGSSWKGIAYMRAMPLSVANPRTVGQINQRTKFGTISAFASGIVGGWIQPLWNRFAVQASGFNDFVRVNLEFVDTDGEVSYSLLSMSRGKLLNIAGGGIMGAPAAGDSTIARNWSNNTGTGNALASDRVHLVAYNVEQKKWSTAVSGQRTNTQLTVQFEDDFVSGDVIYTYMATRRLDGTMVSNSIDNTITIVD